MKKKNSGRPFPRVTEHHLICTYCKQEQDVQQVNAFFMNSTATRRSYACDMCSRSLMIYRSKDGFYRVIKNIDKRKKWITDGRYNAL